MTRIPTGLLGLVAEAVAVGVDRSVRNKAALLVHPDLAAQIWQRWVRQTDETQRREEIQLLASSSREELEPVVTQLVGGLTRTQPETSRSITGFLLQLPSAFRRRLRRPADPDGTTFAASTPLRHAVDLFTFLPRQFSSFTPGDRPADIGDWELVDLMASDDFGETWRARHPHLSSVPSVFLRFCLHPAAKNTLARPETLETGSVLERVLQHGQIPGMLQLKRLHLGSEPPCLEYEFFAGGSLASLVRDWHAAGEPPTPLVVARFVQQIAQMMGQLHQLVPPLVHRGLNPESVLVREAENDQLECRMLDLGLSELLPRTSHDSASRTTVQATNAVVSEVPDIDPQLYFSPQVLRGEPLHPRDDVYALGVLWYQMLAGNLTAGRPGGSQWRRRLSEQGMTSDMIELLEACFEDDPFYRPADAADLASRLDRIIAKDRSREKPSLLDELLSSSPRTQQVAQVPDDGAGEGRAGGRVRQRRSDVWQLFETLDEKAPELSKLIRNNLGMKLVLIPAGSFPMGAAKTEFGARENEWPQREVTLTRGFYFAVTPVTQQQYFLLMGQNPARFNTDNGGSPEHPVESVTWEQATEFCRRLSEQQEERKARRSYRLPTEAEWEYACRAGTLTPFCFGADLSSAQANCDGNFPFGNAPKGRWLQKTTRVGQYPANNFGIHDLHGNVWEWCADWLDATYYGWGPKRDPKGPGDGRYRVLRGGSWKNQAVTCRSAYRNGLNPRLKDNATGFRVVCEVGVAQSL